MKGSIIQRGDSWRVAVSLGKDPTTGKYRQYFETIKGNKGDANRRLRELLTARDNGSFVRPGKLTLGEYLEQWLKDYAFPNLSPRSYEGYEYMVRKHIIPALGQIPLTQLKPQHLQHLYSEKLSAGRSDGKGGLSNRTVQYIHTTLHKSLESAVKLGITVRNPADAVDVPKVSRHEMHTMSESDVYIFLEYTRETPYYSLFYLALFTGMRRSELLAFRWSDIDLMLCQLSITRTIHHLNYGAYKGQVIFKQPKTEKGRRLIALSPSTCIVLREHRAQQEALRQQLGLPAVTDDDLVFSHFDGKPLLPDTITHAWMKLAQRTGLRGVRLHDARHTHASLLLKQNVHPKIVQERLGHASISITLDTYSHVAPGLQQAAAARFDDILMPEPKP